MQVSYGVYFLQLLILNGFTCPNIFSIICYFISMVSPGYISSLFTCSLNEGVLEKKCTKGEVLW